MPTQISGAKIIAPHKVISSEVKPEEARYVYEQAEKMLPLLSQQIGFYNKHLAIAHPQINGSRPLRFFVLNPSLDEFKDWKDFIIINPVILRHTNSTIDSQEGCMSFGKMPMRKVQRWNKCEVEFSVLLFANPENSQDPQPYISERRTASLNGVKAKVWQHEMDHLNAKYIYDVDIKQI